MRQERQERPARSPSPADPADISFGVVKRIDNQVELAVPRDDLEIMGLEDWVRSQVISKIPGS